MVSVLVEDATPREIRNWKGNAWFIEGDIKGFFDNIDFQLLETLINRHIFEKKFVNLYWKLVKAGYVEFDKTKPLFIATNKGVPVESSVQYSLI